MSTYFVGDIHGCYDQLKLLLNRVSFNPVKDILWCTGDLVCRGPKSLDVLHYLFSIKKSVKIVLGNHDLRFLAMYCDVDAPKKEDYIESLLQDKDNIILINWLRKQPILQIDHNRKIIMCHAGIYPFWNINTVQSYAKEVESILSSNDYFLFLHSLHNKINHWHNNIIGFDRFCFIINTFTRMRYINSNHNLDFFCKKSPSIFTLPLLPWFSIKNVIYDDYSIFFGHWASLKINNIPNNIFPLDTGCCWGETLSMIRWENREWFSQSCDSISS